jgi:hypothetical protein
MTTARLTAIDPQFGPPPQRAGGPGIGVPSVLLPGLLKLAANPGQWALIASTPIGKSASSYTTAIKKVKMRGQPAGRWDACTRKLPDGSGVGLWAVYEPAD